MASTFSLSARNERFTFDLKTADCQYKTPT
jgi:hypothetical protein